MNNFDLKISIIDIVLYKMMREIYKLMGKCRKKTNYKGIIAMKRCLDAVWKIKLRLDINKGKYWETKLGFIAAG